MTTLMTTHDDRVTTHMTTMWLPMTTQVTTWWRPLTTLMTTHDHTVTTYMTTHDYCMTIEETTHWRPVTTHVDREDRDTDDRREQGGEDQHQLALAHSQMSDNVSATVGNQAVSVINAATVPERRPNLLWWFTRSYIQRPHYDWSHNSKAVVNEVLWADHNCYQQQSL